MARIVADHIKDAVFYCIGPTDEDPAYYEDCKLLVESLRLTECFHFTGRADVREYYAFLDVLLLTSVREAQPLMILEAYCAGLPVVSTKVGNVPELLDYDDRFLSPSKDPEKLAAGVNYIHDNPGEVAEINRRNRERVLSFYDRKELHSRYRRIYEETLARGRNRV
jgi:glycosyltransferase involved in cell wall biosynthesis